MGNAESQSPPEDIYDESLIDCETLGYRVLGVQPNSPASSAGLVSFLDFLVGCEGRLLLSNEEEDEDENSDGGDVDFVQVLKDSVGKELELLVYNIKSQRTRLVYITPQRDWGGKGLLGVTIRLDDYAAADERLIRVLSVEENSPASIAGLNPLTDYLLGTCEVSFASDVVLGDVLYQFEDVPVEFYVYNTEGDVVRIVTLLPTYSWGGDGLLGAEVGTGYLHALPAKCRDTDGTSVEVRVVRRKVFVSDQEGSEEEIEEKELVDLTADVKLDETDNKAESNGNGVAVSPEVQQDKDTTQTKVIDAVETSAPPPSAELPSKQTSPTASTAPPVAPAPPIQTPPPAAPFAQQVPPTQFSAPPVAPAPTQNQPQPPAPALPIANNTTTSSSLSSRFPAMPSVPAMPFQNTGTTFTPPVSSNGGQQPPTMAMGNLATPTMSSGLPPPPMSHLSR
mmetsp:Transcript_28671/g.42458  ORF Transcript_28671/g.42458 Transcript_28671/m.42458 type:complete len:451 (-) Transcript_28671:66-1418(-)